MKTILAIIAQIFRFLASRNEYAATPAGQRDQQDKRDNAEAKEKQAVTDAVRKGDADKVNSKLKDLYGVLLLSACLFLAGCQTVTYVPQSAAAVPMEKDGMKGWWVPEGTFALMLEDAITLKNLKKEQRAKGEK